MSFLVAFFSVVIYCVMLSRSRAQSRAFQRKSNQQIGINSVIGQRVKAEFDEEQQVESLIMSDPDAAYNEISDNLEAVFGADYKMNFKIFPLRSLFKRKVFASSDTYWAKQLILSKRGKVGRAEYSSGYPIGSPSEKDRNLKFCKQIENNLLQSGTGLRLVLKPGLEDNGYRWDPCGKSMVFEHQLFWEIDKNKARLW